MAVQVDSAGNIVGGKHYVAAQSTYSGVSTIQTTTGILPTPARALAVAVVLTALTGTYQLALDQLMSDGVTWQVVYHGPVRSTPGTVTAEFGPGTPNPIIVEGRQFRLRHLVIGGPATFTASVAGN